MRDAAPRLDDLPARAAACAPARVAVRPQDGPAVTFDELEQRVARCAARLRASLPGTDRRVAVVSALAPEYAVAYYGVLRAGHVVVPVNPFLPARAAAGLIRRSGAELLIAAGEVPDGVAVESVDLCSPALTEADPLADVPARAPGDLASIHFTSGTTGEPKGVCQTHANLAVNAAQTAWAHRLHEGSVTLNHLPTWHPMHLNSGLHALATQALCSDPDPVASIARANEVAADRYYSLPVRLGRLAADRRLPGLRLDTVQGISSGGSALPAPTARALSAHFGIPVMQGYGLAETSPMTHCDVPEDPRPGSCGRPVPGAECRIVGLEDGRTLGPGQPGEIRVRGPQLMAGYLGEAPGAALDDDGWFATGDVGTLEADGRLVVVDRIKDVFKHDNEMVSPQEIERALLEHPAVADCAVVDLPDPLHGAVPVALVVPAAPAGSDRTVTAAEALAAELNLGLPAHHRLAHLLWTGEIPRSGGGKVPRADLRRSVRERLTPFPVPS